MIELDVKDNLLNFSIKLQRRVSFVMGYSATGKSSLYSLLERGIRERDETVAISCNINVALLDFSLLDSNAVSSSTLYVVDDLDVISDSAFVFLLNFMVERDLWFLIMSREEVEYSKKASILYSSNCIYKFVIQDGIYTLSSLYDCSETDDVLDFDCILTEDSTGGFEFFSKLFSGIEIRSTHGKNNVTRCTIQAVTDGYKNILVIFDTANFGSCFEEFYNTSEALDANISFMSTYECFEELLIRTNLLNNLDLVKSELSNLENNANSFKTWESFFEDLVYRATSNKPYRYVHGHSLRRCYTDSCSTCNKHIMEKCDYRNKLQDKLYGLLVRTKYEFLLNR